MVFTPETGTGVAGANSYLDVATYKSIADLLGYDYSTIIDAVIQTRLVRATTVLDSEYRFLFPGARQTTTQGLEWPRSSASYVDGAIIAESTVPPEIQTAMVELVEVLNTGTSIQPVLSASGKLVYNRDRVEGAVESEQRYSIQDANRRDTYTAVSDALSRITGGATYYNKLQILRVGG